MARYIDADALLNALKEERKNGNFVFTSKWIKEIMDNLPSSDVAPRAEVAREIFEEIDKAFDECIYINPFTHIGSLKTNKLVQILIELKNKYAEGKRNDR